MSQVFKSIYFQDIPVTPSAQRHIRLAFGANDRAIFNKIQYLSSEETRQVLGVDSFSELAAYAQDNALSLNRACISLLHKKFTAAKGKNDISTSSLESDPLIATFRSGNGDPLHSWFPFLEGFSPKFVRTVLQTYAPKAKIILDPFAGTGSTPLTAASLGLTGLYCELNPVMQFVAETKYKVMLLTDKQRNQFADKLEDLSFNLSFNLGEKKPDDILRETYLTAFLGSEFFTADILEDVLRLRTLADEILTNEPLFGQVVTVAMFACLVPCSLMIRRGDLRFRTAAELGESPPSLRLEVSNKLREVAMGIRQLSQIFGEAILVTENAQSLSRLPILSVECVVTSPPYLNGTNYFRNTKIELWFLKALTQQADLSRWRLKAITAGINDVTKAKCNNQYPIEVKDVVNDLIKTTYDSRIPKMVGSYFRELEQVLVALNHHLIRGAIVAIDIGDSRYGGVHVETNTLLERIAIRHGFRSLAAHVLRTRKSRDGGTLNQTLLIFENTGYSGTHTPKISLTRASIDQWHSFKGSLPHQSIPFSKRNWGHPLHSLCSYEGKMKPSLAHFLVQTFVPRGGKVLDPFAGVGTIPFEACLQGMKAYGFEISPAALAISVAKVNKAVVVDSRRVMDSLEDYIKSHKVKEGEIEQATHIDFNHSLNEFYNEETFKEIILARRFFIESRPHSVEASLVLACLLHILHGNRPYALSRHSHPVTPFAPSGPSEYRSVMVRLRTKVEKSLAVEYPNEFQNGHIYAQDATLWWPNEVDDLDAIVTSPPFFDSTRFYLANWIRLWFCGWERREFDTEPLQFIDTKQKLSLRVYESIFRQAKERTKRGGIVVLHLGKSSKCDMAKELSAVAKPWFRPIDIFEESVAHCEQHGITDKGRVSTHQYLILG